MLSFPTAGYRDFTSGVSGYHDGNGMYLSGSELSSSNNGWALYFVSHNADSSSSARLYGFSVRCISE